MIHATRQTDIAIPLEASFQRGLYSSHYLLYHLKVTPLIYDEGVIGASKCLTLHILVSRRSVYGITPYHPSSLSI